MEVRGKRCDNCVHYQRLQVDTETGECRNGLPQLGHTLEETGVKDGFRRWGVWPVVEMGDWCSKFELPLV